MDRGKRSDKLVQSSNGKIYMDLKDILREHALVFLPAKSLFRFKGVCRDWKLQISTPFFAHNQSNTFHDFSGFFCQSLSGPLFFIPVDPNAHGVPDQSLSFLPEPVDIRTSCNGLLCCQSRNGDKVYYICNPVTKQWKTLPKHNADHGCDPAVVLAFEPSLLNFVAEYKLLCAFQSPDFDDAYEFEIYSSAEGSWRISGEIHFGNQFRKLIPTSGISVNGIVYWQTTQSHLFAFDLAIERSQILYGETGTLGVMDGKLCVTSIQNGVLVVKMLSNAHTNTMEMSSQVKTWKGMQRINLPKSVLEDASSSFDSRQVASARGNIIKRLVSASGNVVVFRNGNKLQFCDLKSKEIGQLSQKVNNSDLRMISYVNSLVEI
ncbi:F-box protein [Quillaja saponaria]|uniref:F-box protein n=1 Tax=Quillaja saponaria TaxID=32244 RepID=A0AAD7P6U7_QUISA|nr:F-box protein [Quillaja saponaria]KAJ7944306.1 F-box protein [Quillaja saponaria]